MSKLKKLLVQRTEEERDLIGKLAEAIGCNRSVITKFKNTPDKELDSLESLIKVVRILDKNNELVLMIDYSEGIDVNNKTARYMLEYLAINRQTKALRNLLDRMETATNKDSKEWALFYELLYLQLTEYRKVDYKERIITAASYKANTIEMKTMEKLLDVYSHYETKGYKNMLSAIDVVEGLLGEIKDNFVRRAYEARALEMKSYVYLTVKDNREVARELSNQIIELNVNKKFTAYANHTIGLSYLYESYEKGIGYLNRSISNYKEFNSPAVESDIVQVEDTKELFAAVWSKKIDFKINQYSKLYSAYQGENIELDGVFEDEAYKLLAEGIQNKDHNQMLNALIKFIKRGDKFLANLPMLELNKIKYNHDFIMNLININDW